MAIDSAAKRFSMMNLSCPWRGVMVIPSGSVSAGPRAAFLYFYSGVVWTIALTDERTLFGRVIMAVTTGDKFRLRVIRTEGSDNLQTVEKGSSLSINLMKTS